MSPKLRTLLAALLLAPAVAGAQQQTGRVAGTITDANNVPLAAASVSLVGTRHAVATDIEGRYVITNVDPGTYDLRVQRIGQRMRTLPNVAVRAGETTRQDVQLERAPLELAGVTVSASRRVEKITDAPATVTVISPDVLDASIGNTFVSALKEAKGVDFIQIGMTSVAINARGFNSSFNNRFLMVEDGRISVLPENGLPVGSFTATPKVDIAGMEVLVGPGSALYGPDASSGVLSLTTKDPRQFPGATLEVTGGNRSYMDVQGRYAGVTGNLGYKVSGEYQTAKDWENFLCYTAAGSVPNPRPPGDKPTCATGQVREDQLRQQIDWDARVARGSGALVYYLGQGRFELNGGMSRTDGIGQTNVGRNQLSGWTYNVVQGRYTMPHWYVNLYRAQSQSGDSYALNRYAGAQLTNANNTNINADSLRMLSDWPSDGRMYAAEAQGNYTIPQLLNTVAVFGAQFRNDVVSSDRQWLTDRITKSDISNSQQGVYAQTTTSVIPQLDLVLAGRYDKPEQYDAQWSPKAGVVIKPIPDHAFRVTFNRAFKSPTILQTDFFIPDWTSAISIYGNTTGFRVVNTAGTTLQTYAPIKQETNKTWEFGYKGIFKSRLFLDGTYYRSDYKNFMSPLTVLNVPAAGTYAVPLTNPNGIPVDAQGRIVNLAGGYPIVLIYYNLGNAKVTGTDIGANFLATRRIEVRGTLSTVKIDKLTVPAGSGLGGLEATSLNSPGTKWTIGATAKDLGPVSAGLTWRNYVGYYFRSGSNSGIIPTFGTLDANLSYKLPVVTNTQLSVGVNNLLSCSGEDVRYSTPTVTAPAIAQPNSILASEDRACGFNRKHLEMINMPYIGTMVFVGARWSMR